ncbi:MAG: hypothetical protein ACQERB_00190 [Promethearchaeati archaeon]
MNEEEKSCPEEYEKLKVSPHSYYKNYAYSMTTITDLIPPRYVFFFICIHPFFFFGRWSVEVVILFSFSFFSSQVQIINYPIYNSTITKKIELSYNILRKISK